MAAHDQLQLVQVAQIAELLGVTRQRADELTRRKGFPEPDAVVGTYRVWLATTIRDWQKASEKGTELPVCASCGQVAWPRTPGAGVTTAPARKRAQR